jgi:hypothetical protein
MSDTTDEEFERLWSELLAPMCAAGAGLKDMARAGFDLGLSSLPREADRATECAKSLLALADWSEAPIRTEWGAGMMVADVELTKDETLTAYVHRDVLVALAA